MSAPQEMASAGNPIGLAPRLGTGEAAGLGAVFLLALVLRIWVAARVATLFEDGPRFLATASHMAAGEWTQAFQDSYHPLYSFLIQAVARLTGDPERVAVAISVLAGSLAVLALYVFLRQAWNGQVALVGAFLLAIHPYAIRFSSSVQSEGLYLFLFLGAVALLLRTLDRPGFTSALLCGGVVGLAYLTRPEGLVVGLVGAVAMGVLWLRRLLSTSVCVRGWAGLLLGFIVVALPYFLSLKSVTGMWQISQKKSILVLIGLMKHQAGPGSDLVWTGGTGQIALLGLLLLSGLIVLFLIRRWGRSGGLGVAVPPLWFACAVLAAILTMALLDFAAFWHLALALVSALRPEQVAILLVGIAVGALHSGRNSSLLLGLLITTCLLMLYTLVLNYGYVSRRHCLPPLVLLFGYGAVGVVFLGEWLGRHGLRTARVGLVLTLTLLALISLPKAFRGHRDREYAGRVVAERLAAAPGQIIFLASERSKSAYYAKLSWSPLLNANGGYRSIGQLHEAGVRFVLLEIDPSENHSALGPLPPGLRLEERDRAIERGRMALLLEIVESRPTP